MKAVYAFPRYIQKPEHFTLVRASGTDLPIADQVADVTLCWGVLHHMNDPEAGLMELLRVTKPGGMILIFVYPKQFDARKNLNAYIRGLPEDQAHGIIERLSDEFDAWREVDPFYANQLAPLMALSFKSSRAWQKFQWFDGITPRYHWSIEQRVAEWGGQGGRKVVSYRPGCFNIQL